MHEQGVAVAPENLITLGPFFYELRGLHRATSLEQTGREIEGYLA